MTSFKYLRSTVNLQTGLTVQTIMVWLQICAPKAVVYGVRKGGSGCVKGVRGASGASGVHFG